MKNPFGKQRHHGRGSHGNATLLTAMDNQTRSFVEEQARAIGLAPDESISITLDPDSPGGLSGEFIVTRTDDGSGGDEAATYDVEADETPLP
jgi:hypothetical protein